MQRHTLADQRMERLIELRWLRVKGDYRVREALQGCTRWLPLPDDATAVFKKRSFWQCLHRRLPTLSHQKSCASNGIITTVVRTGTNGYSGDGGPTTSAQIGYVDSIALDANDNLYFPDYGCSCIRKVDASSGVASSVVGNGTNGYSGDGGAATSASLVWPEALTFDSSGNMYIIDQYMTVIRKVTASTGVITTVAGRSCDEC